MNKITIFTPTYNRGYTLKKLYESLCQQTNKNFEWLIVDDGSTDDTKSIIEDWMNEQLINIRYIYQKNAGKMMAHNLGVINTTTELFLCIDSDDHVVNNAVDTILNTWIKEDNMNLAGIILYRGETKDKVIGNYFPKESVNSVSSLCELYEKGFLGDTTMVFSTKVIKQFPFPIVDGEKFITEAYVYDQIDQMYKYLVIPKIITVCEYLDDGYTNNTLMLYNKYPKGWALYYKQKAGICDKNKKQEYYSQYVSFAIGNESYSNILSFIEKKYRKKALVKGVLIFLNRKKMILKNRMKKTIRGI